jgi:hypothetical protein
MTDSPPPLPPTTIDPIDPAPAAPAQAASATRGDKRRLVLILGGIVVFLVVVLFAVRNNQSADDLAVGTCFDVPGRDTDISTVTSHPCAEAHDAEVFHVAEYTGNSYPISISLDSFIDDACVPAFATYVGEAYDTNEDLTLGYFYPSRDAWDNGDRTVTCYVAREDKAKMTESVKAAP